jgi:hypothetical protein
MKKITSIIFLIFAFAGIIFAQPNTPKVIVYYFHATHRCPTCMEIEAKTKMVLADNFRDEIISGTVQFKVFDYEDPANKKLVDRYFAYGSTLLLVYPENEEQNKDLTDMAFQYVMAKPEVFKEELSKEIEKLIVSD